MKLDKWQHKGPQYRVSLDDKVIYLGNDREEALHTPKHGSIVECNYGHGWCLIAGEQRQIHRKEEVCTI